MPILGSNRTQVYHLKRVATRVVANTILHRPFIRRIFTTLLHFSYRTSRCVHGFTGWFHGYTSLLETATKRSIVHNARRGRRDRVTAVRLEYTNGTVLGRTHATSGCAAVAVARSGGRALKQERVPHLGSSDVSVVRARWCWPTCAYSMAPSSPP